MASRKKCGNFTFFGLRQPERDYNICHATFLYSYAYPGRHRWRYAAGTRHTEPSARTDSERNQRPVAAPRSELQEWRDYRLSS